MHQIRPVPVRPPDKSASHEALHGHRRLSAVPEWNAAPVPTELPPERPCRNTLPLPAFLPESQRIPLSGLRGFRRYPQCKVHNQFWKSQMQLGALPAASDWQSQWQQHRLLTKPSDPLTRRASGNTRFPHTAPFVPVLPV